MSKATAEGFEMLAADRISHTTETDCAYDSCLSEADWVVAYTHQDTRRVRPLFVCQRCSRQNRIYAQENNLYQRDMVAAFGGDR